MELTAEERKLVLDTMVAESKRTPVYAERALKKILDLVEVLGIVEKRGFYRTGYGRKTKIGLILTIYSIIA